MNKKEKIKKKVALNNNLNFLKSLELFSLKDNIERKNNIKIYRVLHWTNENIGHAFLLLPPGNMHLWILPNGCIFPWNWLFFPIVSLSPLFFSIKNIFFSQLSFAFSSCISSIRILLLWYKRSINCLHHYFPYFLFHHSSIYLTDVLCWQIITAISLQFQYFLKTYLFDCRFFFNAFLQIFCQFPLHLMHHSFYSSQSKTLQDLVPTKI